jgi:hypothetical protein
VLSLTRHSRWIVRHRASRAEHRTEGRAQYAFGALQVAIDEGFATRLLDENQCFPAFSDCEFVELEDADDDEARVDASIGRVA